MANLLSFMLERTKVDYSFLPARQAVHLLSTRAPLFRSMPLFLSLSPPLSVS